MAGAESIFHPMNADSEYESSERPEFSSDEDAPEVGEPHDVPHFPLCSCSGMWKPWLIVPEAFVDGPEKIFHN